MLKSSWHYMIVNSSNPPSCTSLLHLFISWENYTICLSKPQGKGSWETAGPLKTNWANGFSLNYLILCFSM